jgi:hypothetical protein
MWSLHFDQIYPKLTPELVEKYATIYGISGINPKGKKRTYKQYIKEFIENYVWIEL